MLIDCIISIEIVLWDTEDVCYWLKAIELGEYATMFKENDVTGADLMGMKTASLQVRGTLAIIVELIFH